MFSTCCVPLTTLRWGEMTWPSASNYRNKERKHIFYLSLCGFRNFHITWHVLWEKCLSRFTNCRTKAQRSEVTYPTPHSKRNWEANTRSFCWSALCVHVYTHTHEHTCARRSSILMTQAETWGLLWEQSKKTGLMGADSRRSNRKHMERQDASWTESQLGASWGGHHQVQVQFTPLGLRGMRGQNTNHRTAGGSGPPLTLYSC